MNNNSSIHVKASLPILTCQGLTKIFQTQSIRTEILKNITLNVYPGEQIAIIGPSGAGKSTLLHLLGGLDEVTSGHIWINRQDITQMNDKQRTQIRSQHLGFIYQFHHLLPEFTVLENVCIPLLLRDEKPKEAAKKALALLKKVGMSQRQTHKPAELSGGERQRVAIARALVTQPSCLLADEPTGNLDRQTANQIYQTLKEANQDHQVSLIIATHDHKLAQQMHRTLYLQDKELQPRSSLA